MHAALPLRHGVGSYISARGALGMMATASLPQRRKREIVSERGASCMKVNLGSLWIATHLVRISNLFGTFHHLTVPGYGCYMYSTLH